VKIDQLIPQKDVQEMLVKSGEGTYFSNAIFITAKSGYHEFAMFVNGLENARVLWKIDDLVIAADPADTRRPAFKMTMRFVTLERTK
jgi:hypothetical protein